MEHVITDMDICVHLKMGHTMAYPKITILIGNSEHDSQPVLFRRSLFSDRHGHPGHPPCLEQRNWKDGN